MHVTKQRRGDGDEESTDTKHRPPPPVQVKEAKGNLAVTSSMTRGHPKHGYLICGYGRWCCGSPGTTQACDNVIKMFVRRGKTHLSVIYVREEVAGSSPL